MSRVAVGTRSMEGTFRIQFDCTVVTSTFVVLDTLLIVLLELIQFYHGELLLQRAGSLLLLGLALLLLHVGVPSLVVLLLQECLIVLRRLPFVFGRRLR